eukprot:1160633-Pelagomonas_calceolata.AAC.9
MQHMPKVTQAVGPTITAAAAAARAVCAVQSAAACPITSAADGVGIGRSVGGRGRQRLSPSCSLKVGRGQCRKGVSCVLHQTQAPLLKHAQQRHSSVHLQLIRPVQQQVLRSTQNWQARAARMHG